MISPVEYAKRINRTWIVHGNLGEDTETYLQHLGTTRLDVLEEVCALAVRVARDASQENRDPKPAFYAALFSRSTPDEQERFLKNHFWTRRLVQQ